MPHLNVFESDAFSLMSLTAAINEAPHKPGLLGELGLFSEEGISTTHFDIEIEKETFSLVPAQPRGAPGHPKGGNGRSLIAFRTVHLPQRATILADQVQNVRAFGTDDQLQPVQSVINQRVAKMRGDIDVTLEWQRIGAIKGQILDADGSTIVNLFTTFGVAQNTATITFGNDATKIMPQVLNAIRQSEDELGNVSVSGYMALCGKNFFNALISNKEVRETYLNWSSNEVLRRDNRAGFLWGEVYWREYRGKVGGTSFIGDNDAYLVPLGVPDLFITRFSPADYMETVNTIGLPYYAKSEPMKFGKGVELEAQSNPLCLCTRPRAVVKLSLT